MTEEEFQNKLRDCIGNEINTQWNQYILTDSKAGYKWLSRLGKFSRKFNDDASIIDRSFVPTEYYIEFVASIFLRSNQHHIASNIVKNTRNNQYIYYIARVRWIQSQPRSEGRTKLLKLLCYELRKKNADDDLDSYSLYLYGDILYSTRRLNEARMVLLKCVTIDPMNILAWFDLDQLICDRETYMSLTLPNHWMSMFFEAHMRKKIWDFPISFKTYEKLYSLFNESMYIRIEMTKLKLFLLECFNYFDPERTGYIDLETLTPDDLQKIKYYANLHNLQMTLRS